MVPIMDVDSKLNAYVWNFFRHGSVEDMREVNGLKTGDDVQLLRDFHFVIKSIKSSLGKLAPPGDAVLKSFSILDCVYRRKLASFEAELIKIKEMTKFD